MAQGYSPNVVGPTRVASGDTVHVVYSLPLPHGWTLVDAVKSVSEAVKKANYGFDTEVRPKQEDAPACKSHDAVLLYMLVPAHLDFDRVAGLGFSLANEAGMVLLERSIREQLDADYAAARSIDPYLQTR